MPRKPSGSQLVDQVDDLIVVLRTAKTVFPVLAEQARLEARELTGGLPANPEGVGDDYSTDPPPHYSDPTGETVVHFRAPVDGNCRPTEDLERIARWVGDVRGLLGATRRMLNNAPAVTLSVVAGRKPTDGRSAEEFEQRKFVRALTDDPCLISHDHHPDDRFGPGQLRRGLCDRHRKQFGRWCDDQQILPLDPGERLVRWQADTFGKVAGASDAEQPAEDAGPYKRLKEVA